MSYAKSMFASYVDVCRVIPFLDLTKSFAMFHSPSGISPGGNSTQSHFKGHGSELEVIQSLAQLQVGAKGMTRDDQSVAH